MFLSQKIIPDGGFVRPMYYFKSVMDGTVAKMF
jgi:hypothetical protein